MAASTASSSIHAGAGSSHTGSSTGGPMLDGVMEHYGDSTAMTGLDPVLKGPPALSVWEQAVGFNEW